MTGKFGEYYNYLENELLLIWRLRHGYYGNDIAYNSKTLIWRSLVIKNLPNRQIKTLAKFFSLYGTLIRLHQGLVIAYLYGRTTLWFRQHTIASMRAHAQKWLFCFVVCNGIKANERELHKRNRNFNLAFTVTVPVVLARLHATCSLFWQDYMQHVVLPKQLEQ